MEEKDKKAPQVPERRPAPPPRQQQQDINALSLVELLKVYHGQSKMIAMRKAELRDMEAGLEQVDARIQMKYRQEAEDEREIQDKETQEPARRQRRRRRKPSVKVEPEPEQAEEKTEE